MIQGAEAVDRERPRRRIGMIGAERADIALVAISQDFLSSPFGMNARTTILAVNGRVHF
jgi:hypothetical protein